MNLYYKLTCVVLPAALIAACSASGSKKPAEKTAVAATPSIIQHSVQDKTQVETLAEKINSTEQGTVDMKIPEAEKFPLTQIANAKDNTKPAKRVYQFGFNKQELDAIDQGSLQDHANYLIANPNTILLINGHSDTQGNANYNLFLSKERAKKAAQFLIEYGAPENQIKITGMGDSQPLNDVNSFKENRRVELQYSDSRVATK
ncbi:hypothetical protein MNBD_GAMMA23-1879 [hydrothermal vent metagenome]|uniref:OmpA-like domain-containing protein n=1 Tax=hydrothermal vent metagenome TaxID=652676 RepID=A0A3B0ZTA9_9ZZZZ